MGLKSDFIDGNDVNVLDKIIPEIVKYVRSGKGPYFLECDTYRYREHCGPNFDDELF